MACSVVLGTQWGDEGKGKITDLLAADFDAVARFQGGNNAGHTIVVGGKRMALHIVPSGVIHPGKVAVIGDGCVVDPWVLLKELDYLKELGIGTENVFLSDRAHLIMPYHRKLDGIQESLRSKGKKVGTTGRGIGPCYMDKAGRFGIRAGDLRYPEIVRERLEAALRAGEAAARAAGTELGIDIDVLAQELESVRVRLQGRIRDTDLLLNDLIEEGKTILLEGAQGQFLDIDRGTYPFVTSSSCTVGNAASGSGIGVKNFKRIYGVAKAYTTRVGEGPFPTELTDDLGERIREVGHEYGTTTERPRRCGWLDLVLVRSSVRWNSIDTLAVTKLDVLKGLGTIKVCTAYRIDDGTASEHMLPSVLKYFPSHLKVLERCEPIYTEMKGWGEVDWASGKIAPPVRRYLGLIEKETGARAGIVSYGPGREETIVR
jgi:adenylosuccinate synthase